MQRLKRHAELGLRWVRCGWRLFQRNPWLLAGMGVCFAVAAVIVVQVPVVGVPFLGLLVPIGAASFYIAVDGISKQKMRLPTALRLAAVKQSPREFLNIAHREQRLMQVLVIGFYGLVIVVLTDIVMWLVAGNALASPLSGLSISGLLAVGIATLIKISVYLLLAASLIYTLPLALLQNQALVPAMVGSTRRALHYGVALLVIAGLFLGPIVFGTIVTFYLGYVGYALGLFATAIVLPIAICSLYCSYRTVFPPDESAQPIGTEFKRANYV